MFCFVPTWVQYVRVCYSYLSLAAVASFSKPREVSSGEVKSESLCLFLSILTYPFAKSKHLCKNLALIQNLVATLLISICSYFSLHMDFNILILIHIWKFPIWFIHLVITLKEVPSIQAIIYEERSWETSTFLFWVQGSRLAAGVTWRNKAQTSQRNKVFYYLTNGWQ